MAFGKQIRFCPNCGIRIYDTIIEMRHVKSMMCCDECRKEWELKYARSILRINDDIDESNIEKFNA